MNDLYTNEPTEKNLETPLFDELKWLYYELFKGVPCLEPCFSRLTDLIQDRPASPLPDQAAASVSLPGTGSASSPDSGLRISGKNSLGMVLHADTFADTIEDLPEKISYLQETGVNFLHVYSLPDEENRDAFCSFISACHQSGITVCVSVITQFHSPAAINKTISDMLFYAGHGADMMYPETLPGQRLRPPVLRILRVVCDMVCPSFRLAGEQTCSGIDMKYECSFLYNTTLMASVWNSVATEDVALLKHTLDSSCKTLAAPRYLNFLRRQDLLNWDLDYEYLRNSGQDERVHRHFLNDFFTGIFPGSFSRGNLYHTGSHFTSSGLCGTTASFCGIEKYGFEGNRKGVSTSVDLILMLYAFIFSLPGCPVLSAGDEIGMVNDYSYRRNKELLSDDRHLHHSPFRWDLAERRYQEGTVQNRIFTSITSLARIRQEHSEFFRTASLRSMDTWSRSVLALVRETEKEKFIGLYNFHREKDVAWINEEDGLYLDLLSGSTLEAKGITLEPFTFLWLIKTK